MDVDKLKSMLMEQSGTKIKVVGVGGGGGNAINRMIRSGIKGVTYIAMNTDLVALQHSSADMTLTLGKQLTRGLGAGGKPEVGRDAAIESKEEIKSLLEGTDMLFLTTGMGGGTGTGATPVIAEIAREMNILTVGIVTIPFNFEGKKKIEQAYHGVENLKKYIDALIQVPNQALITLDDGNEREDISMADALLLADNVLLQGISGITRLITEPGEINIDFADVKSVMQGAGEALMGIGEAKGENRALVAVKRAINNPILDNSRLNGAKNVLISISSNGDLTLKEFKDIGEYVEDFCDKDALIKTGQSENKSLDGSLRITVVATGFSPHASALDTQMATLRLKTGASFSSTKEVDEGDKIRIVRHWQDLCPACMGGFDKNDYSIPTILRQRVK